MKKHSFKKNIRLIQLLSSVVELIMLALQLAIAIYVIFK